MEFTNLTDEQLAEHLNAVLAEQERRQRLAAAPTQIAEMAARFVADGGDRATVIEAVSAATPASE